MKKTSSLVWRFFDRLQEDKRCVAVLCKLCDTQYKYFGNTTNLRTHLVNKHPIQWDLLHTGSLDETTFRTFDDDPNTSHSTKRKKYIKTYKDNSVDVLENSETDNETHNEVLTTETEPISIVRQMHGSRGSDEEWLNDDLYETVESYEPQRKRVKYRKIKREVTSPPAKASYVVRNSTGTSYQRPDRIIIDGGLRQDEYSVFGQYVGNKLRKMSNIQARGNVQQLITTILWQAEYGLYDSMETVKRVLLHSVQEMEVVHPTIEQIIVQAPHDDVDAKES